MSDRIDFRGQPWNAIPRALLRDARLSPQAKGGLVTLLSHEEGWVRSAIALLQRENDCGRDRARAIMRELVETGYAEASTSRNGSGQFVTTYTIHPLTGSGSPARRTDGNEARTSGSTVPVDPATGSPATGNPSAVVEALDVEPLDEEPQTKGALVRADEAQPARDLVGESAKPPVSRRDGDAIWEALWVVLYGQPWQPGTAMTKSSRGAMNEAVRQLRTVDATPETIAKIPDAWLVMWQGRQQPTCTASAIAKHWPGLKAIIDHGYVARGSESSQGDELRRALREVAT